MKCASKMKNKNNLKHTKKRTHTQNLAIGPTKRPNISDLIKVKNHSKNFQENNSSYFGALISV